MKIFYYPSYRGQKYYKDLYKKIYNILQKLGYEVINSDAIADANVVFKNFDRIGPEAYLEKYNELNKQTKNCDIAIFDTSFPSLAVGYLIDQALRCNKPVIALRLKETRPSYFLANIEDEKFQLVEYTEANLESALSKAIRESLNLREKRFNFFVSPEMLTYLEEASTKENITKSTFIRNLINEHRKKKSREHNQ